jgi:hypothetical protein
VLAQPAAFAERCSPVPASADGIGKRYMGREISAVMGWQGAAWLEAALRRACPWFYTFVIATSAAAAMRRSCQRALGNSRPLHPTYAGLVRSLRQCTPALAC